jgi:hypothetical protein
VKVISVINNAYDKALFEFSELSFDKKSENKINILGLDHKIDEIIEKKNS